VDIQRFDSFFDHLVHGLYFDFFKISLPTADYSISHVYLNFNSKQLSGKFQKLLYWVLFGSFFRLFKKKIKDIEFAKKDEAVYGYKMLAPGGKGMSITIVHCFYSHFKVVSILTRKNAIKILANSRRT